MWEGNAYTDVGIIGDSYLCSHLPLSGLQRGVSPGQILYTYTKLCGHASSLLMHCIMNC